MTGDSNRNYIALSSTLESRSESERRLEDQSRSLGEGLIQQGTVFNARNMARIPVALDRSNVCMSKHMRKFIALHRLAAHVYHFNLITSSKILL